MTYPSPYNDDPQTYQDQSPEPIPVHVASSAARPVRHVAPEYGNCMTWFVDTFTNMNGKEIMILPKRYRRDRAKIIVQSLAPIGTPTDVNGTATAPAVNTTLCTIGIPSLTPGATFIVNWNVGLTGTPGAGDANNFRLIGPAFNTLISDNPGVVGGPWTQAPVQFTVPIGNNTTLRIQSDGTIGTAGAVYFGQMSITPVVPAGGGSGASLVLNSNRSAVQATTPQGLIIATPTVVEWRSQRACFAVLTPSSTVGPLTVCTLDESFEES